MVSHLICKRGSIPLRTRSPALCERARAAAPGAQPEADVAPEDWRFERGPDGKPALCHHHHPALYDLRFNLAPCQGMAAEAVARGREVGIDVEHLEAIQGADELAATILAPAERAQWLRIENDAPPFDRFQ